MDEPLPVVIRIYQHHTLDSTRWHHFVQRDDDIVVATSYKSGTTWVQAILAHLILGTQSIPNIDTLSPWLDLRETALDDVLALLEAQQHRRFIKTHLALDGLPFYPQVKYIVVGRDPRDVFMSFWNHLTTYADAQPEAADAPPRDRPPAPPAPQDIHEFWREWITRGTFEWETEGYPYWGNLHHTKTWWPYRTRDNVLFVHYNDLLADLGGEIRRIVRFLDMQRSDEQLAEVAHAVTFSTMKQNAAQLLPGAETGWKGGARTFVFKGTNGRWKDVLSQDELALCTEALARVLTPECAAWLQREPA
jgi:aryl sulfotransferase